MFFFSTTGYYLGNANENCNETCNRLGNDILCLPMYQPFNRPMDGTLLNPDNYTLKKDFSCSNDFEAWNSSKPEHPVIDISDDSCIGFVNGPLFLNCKAKAGLSPTERRLCYCGNEGWCFDDLFFMFFIYETFLNVQLKEFGDEETLSCTFWDILMKQCGNRTMKQIINILIIALERFRCPF